MADGPKHAGVWVKCILLGILWD